MKLYFEKQNSIQSKIRATNNQLQFTQVVTLGFVCSGQMNAEHNEHLELYFVSFALGQNAQRFLFPFPEFAGIGSGTCYGRGPITDAIAAWTDNGKPALGGFALALISGFTSSEPKSLLSGGGSSPPSCPIS